MSRQVCLLLVLAAGPARADDATDALAKELRDYAAAELAKVPGTDGKYSTALSDYLRDEIAAANRRDREAWGKVTSREQWEAFRDARINALRESLGTWPEVPKSVPTRVTRTIDAAGYRIDNLLYESRPDVWVTGNLYYPDKPPAKMPVILIAHSHHAPKEQGELQDMGVTWAKLGCLVLVIDQLGHGERRQHPFATAKDYPREFRVGRQDYYFRYNLNLQLSLVGDSLMGWMAWDLMRGLDAALARPEADRERVILLGAVAGGGDIAAVTAALDGRFKCVVPLNFGGPQPETRYPLPENADEWFNYAGSGSWESTRNLRDSAAKGFLPWVIVASVAPRKVVHAHEFSWDRDRDPVWKRYQKVWGFYDAADSLASTHGTGVIQGNDPTASHCTNIGPIHRQGIYAALKKWFDIPIPEKESSERRPAAELHCWTDEARKELKSKPLHEVLAGMADCQRGARPPQTTLFEGVGASFRLAIDEELGRPQQWPRILLPGSRGCEAYSWPAGRPRSTARALMFKPEGLAETEKVPAVCCIAQEGAHSFLAARSQAVAALLRAKVAVLLVNWRGTGLDRPGEGWGRSSWAASLANTAEMLGTPLAALRINETRNTLRGALRDFGAVIDPERVLVWGESLSEPNGPDQPVAVPQDLAQPGLAEPFAATLASLLGLNRSQFRVKAVVARGGLVSYRSVLDSPFVHVPHDALPVNVFRAGDLPDLWAHLAPKPLRLEGLVDGTNRRVTGERLEKALRPVTEAYRKGGLVVKEDYTPDADLAKWIVEQLKR
jgi:dienelactone hydrolase